MSKRQTVEYYCDICNEVYPEDKMHEVTIPMRVPEEGGRIQYTDGHICFACSIELAHCIKQLQQCTCERNDAAESAMQQDPDSLQEQVSTKLHNVLQYTQMMYPDEGAHYAYCGPSGRIFTKDTCNPKTARVYDTTQYAPTGLNFIVTDLPDLGTWLSDNADSIPESFRYAAVDVNGVACACINPPVFTLDKDSWDDFAEDTYSIPGVWDARYHGTVYSLVHYRKGTPK